MVPIPFRSSAAVVRAGLMASVLLLHLIGVWVLSGHAVVASGRSSPPLMIVELLRIDSSRVALSFAEPILDTPGIPDLPLPTIRTVSDASVHLSPPEVDLTARVELAPYARSAGLRAGESAAIVLLVDVLPDGSTGDVSVKLSGGRSVIDAAAIAYVRALHWIPAVLDGKSVKSHILFGVNLSCDQS